MPPEVIKLQGAFLHYLLLRIYRIDDVAEVN